MKAGPESIDLNASANPSQNLGSGAAIADPILPDYSASVDLNRAKVGSAGIFKAAEIGPSRTIIASVAILALTFACYFKSLNCWFFSDDFLCLDYLYRIFHGEPFLLLQRMSSSWQDQSISLLYRPLCDLSLALDYSLWRSSAFGYHLSNLLLIAAASVLVFLLSKRLLEPLDPRGAFLPALFAGAIFAAYPLHIEPVLWIVCRADLASTALLLLFLYMCIGRLQNGQKFGLLPCLVFLCALLFKESAACASVMLFSYLLIVESKERNLLASFRLILPFVLITVAYFCLRFSVLGTFTGGYTGSLGQTMLQNWYGRIVDLDLPALIALSANLTVFKSDSLILSILRSSYLLMAAIIAIRIPIMPWTERLTRILLFLTVCVALALLPTFQVVSLSSALTNSRVFYLASAFLIPLALAALYPLKEEADQTVERWKQIHNILQKSSQLALSVLLISFSIMTVASIDPWVEGSKMLTELRSSLISELKKLGPAEHAIVLNFPASHNGSHLMYEFRELQTIVGPVFGIDYSRKIVALDEYPDFIASRAQRLKDLLADPDKKVLWFDRDSLTLAQIARVDGVGSTVSPLLDKQSSMSASAIGSVEVKGQEQEKLGNATATMLPLTCDRVDQDAFMASFASPIPFREASQLEFDVEWKKMLGRPVVAFAFCNGNTIPSEEDLFYLRLNFAGSGRHKYTVSVFDIPGLNPHGRGESKLYLRVTRGSKVHAIRFIEESELAQLRPRIETFRSLANGNLAIKAGVQAVVEMDVSKVRGAKSILLEISKPNLMFNFGKVSSHDPHQNKNAALSLNLQGRTLSFPLDMNTFKENALYQMRICAVDKKGRLIGGFSDPIVLDRRNSKL